MAPKLSGKKRDAAAVEIDVDAEPSVATTTKPSNFLAELAAKKHQSEAQKVLGTATSNLNLFQYITEEGWRTALQPLTAKKYWHDIEMTLEAEFKQGKEIYPPLPQVFTAFNVCPLTKTKVVLIGQDPYHDTNQAHGLCFSVAPGIKPPPSLVNMYKELAADIPGFVAPNHGYLTSWAEQGILMLNASLTVEAHQANSHSKIGWMAFTDDVVKFISDNTTGMVFLLWGGFAQKKGAKVDRKKHRVIEVAHPSPLSVKHWVGCKTFSKCNAALKELGKTPINWQLPPL